ncbi:MAG: efflux RND transporter periplasmic adaptor subunit [Gemmobacter sp.]|nr:efflux RND transporter periplasmic adaptor subunit [Gemmobacter sp.]
MMLAPVGVRAQEAMQQTKPVLTLPAISVSEASMRDLRERVIAGGLVGAVEQVIVQPLIEGQPIEALEAEAGDYVDQGQVLARLSLTALELQRSQLKAGLASAKAAVAQAEAQVLEAVSAADEAARVATRTATLNERGQASAAANDQAQAGATAANARVTVARQMAEAARAQVELAEAQLANVELNLTRTNVVAPVAGEVLLRNAQIGAVASATGQPMFVLMKNGALELRAEIAEADLIGLQPGMGAWVRAVGMAEPLSGTVRLVEPGVNAATRLGTARITLDNTHILRSGMYAEAEIVVAERRALAVPVTAVGAAAEGATVMVVRDGIVHRAAVRTGIRDAGWIEIVSGLAEGEQVVTKAAAFVRDGDRVNPIAAPTQ